MIYAKTQTLISEIKSDFVSDFIANMPVIAAISTISSAANTPLLNPFITSVRT